MVDLTQKANSEIKPREKFGPRKSLSSLYGRMNEKYRKDSGIEYINRSLEKHNKEENNYFVRGSLIQR